LNVLSSEQASTALKFAKKGGVGKFNGVRWDLDHGVPRIAGVAGWVACTVDQIIEGGDHMIVLGNVVSAEHVQGEPLTYHGRVFGTHSAIEALQ